MSTTSSPQQQDEYDPWRLLDAVRIRAAANRTALGQRLTVAQLIKDASRPPKQP